MEIKVNLHLTVEPKLLALIETALGNRQTSQELLVEEPENENVEVKKEEPKKRKRRTKAEIEAAKNEDGSEAENDSDMFMGEDETDSKPLTTKQQELLKAAFRAYVAKNSKEEAKDIIDQYCKKVSDLTQDQLPSLLDDLKV